MTISDNVLPRDAMLARYMLSSSVRPSVGRSIRPSVRPSQVAVLRRLLNLGSRKQRHTKTGILIYWRQRCSGRNSNGVSPNGSAK